MKRIFAILVLSLSLLAAHADDWKHLFQSPPVSAHPWTFWYWMYGCVDGRAVRADLEAMHDAGIAGFYLMPIKGTGDGKDYGGTAQQLSTTWWQLIDSTFRIADSLHLEMGIHFSDGFALGGGPWIKPEESMQRVVWTDTVVEIKDERKRLHNDGLIASAFKHQSVMLHPSSNTDVAAFAYSAKDYDPRKPRCSVQFPFRADDSCSITMSYETPYLLRSVKIVTGGNNYQAHRFSIYASDDGVNYRFVCKLKPARQGWQNTDAPATYSIPSTRSRFFQLRWSPRGSEPGCEDMDAAKWKPALKVAEIILGSEPIIDGYEGKSGSVWRVSESTPDYDNDCIPADKIIRLSMDGDRIVTKLPYGRWHILRIGHASTGHTNATGGGGRGLECDKFSRIAIRKQFNNWFGAIYHHVPADLAHRVLTRFHVDSWECGSQNWSDNFAAEFRARRGYDLMPWLPLFAGVPIGSREKSDSVLRDIRQTIADLICDVFYDETSRLAHQYGCEMSAESVAPTMVSDGMRHYRYTDLPMGEFWYNSPTHDKPNDMLDAISGAHVYGKRIIQAEGFTEVRGTWDEHPAMLKTLLDRNLCLGMNRLTFHVFTHNPWLDRHPGMTLDGIGTFFQRDQTWWKQMPAFTDYIARCQALLQYGEPVVDIAVFTGDEYPQRSLLPYRLIGTLPGLLGEDFVKKETKRQLNVGQTLEVSPVGVTHSANIDKAEDWINPLHGYAYDSMNPDALQECHVDKGELVTAAGMRYRALAVSQSLPMNPNMINSHHNKIDSMKAVGLEVIDTPWRQADLSSVGIFRDVILPQGIAYAHRHASDIDIYFLCNQTDTAKTFRPHFRVSQYSGEITLTARASAFCIFAKDSAWIADPMTGSIASLVGYNAKKIYREEPIIPGMWQISFQNDTCVSITKKLFDWTSSNDKRIKYYSGTVDYKTKFRFGKVDKQSSVCLDLGRVENIAHVYVNGIDCGTAWMAPYVVDISKAIKRGKNVLTVKVVNTWANALKGMDNGTPPFAGIWTNGKYRRADNSLLPAGLLGPVKLLLTK